MTTPPPRFIDYSTLPSFPARPTVQRRRSVWLVSLLVLAGVTLAGTVLGPVVLITAFHLSPLFPLNVVLGMVVGTAYGLAAGVVSGAVTAVVLAVVRAGQAGPADSGVAR